jgi:glucose/arabinose dehydrogenase
MRRHVLSLAFLVAAMPLATQAQTIMTLETDAGPVAVERVADGLSHPWSLVFLPDGRALVTERSGTLRIVGTDGTLSEPLAGTPEVYARNQGGLLDVELDPNFADNSLVYLAYAEPGEGGGSTAVGRGRLEGGRIADFETLFSQQPKYPGGRHFGGRIEFSPSGHLYLTTGDRGQQDPAQDLTDHLGTVIRLNPDGSVPDDNPYVGRDDALPEIFSYGHRNIEAADFHPETGELWIAEMGPYGGDELNQPDARENHGWPVVSWGDNYDGTNIPDPPTHPEFADAATYWVPSISPSGMTFYTGDRFPEWRGSILIGGLSGQTVVRVTVDSESESAEEVERLEVGERIREVQQGPDGSVYLLTDRSDGAIWRLVPAQ